MQAIELRRCAVTAAPPLISFTCTSIRKHPIMAPTTGPQAAFGLFVSLYRPCPIPICNMHLLLFEALAHLGCQFVEQLADRAIIKIARVLRENPLR
jgi:hypothetical protein